MNKKLLLLLMVSSVMFTACGEKIDEEVVVKSKESRKVVEIAQAAEDTEVEETVMEKIIEEDSPTKLTKGIITENGWENEWLGMRYITPEGMTMDTQEELDASMGCTWDMVEEDFDEWQTKYAELNTVLEMSCMAQDGAANVNLVVEKMLFAMDMDTYIEALKDTFAQTTIMSFEIVGDTKKTMVADREFTQLSGIASYEGMEVNQTYYLAIVDDRMVCITVTYADPETAESVMSGFEVY